MSEQERSKWDARYSVPGYRKGEDPSPWLTAQAPHLPRQGASLDLAAGEGQNAVYLATLGLESHAVDISSMGRRKAAVLAVEWGVTVHYTVADLDADPGILAPARYDVITCFHFLNRDLIGPIEAALKPGGLVVVEILGERNLERHAHPSARYLLAEGELATWWPGMEDVASEEGWVGEVFVCRGVWRKG